MSEKIATREAYGKALAELGNVNDKVVVLDADLAGATMTKHFKAAHPERFFDCGIAEADMVDISAGLSTMGLVPFCSTFARDTFRPPAVDPAQPPMNISANKIARDSPGQTLKSAVA